MERLNNFNSSLCKTKKIVIYSYIQLYEIVIISYNEIIIISNKTIFEDIHYTNLTVMVGYRILIAQDVEYLRCVWVLMYQLLNQKHTSNLLYGWNCFSYWMFLKFYARITKKLYITDKSAQIFNLRGIGRYINPSIMRQNSATVASGYTYRPGSSSRRLYRGIGELVNPLVLGTRECQIVPGYPDNLQQQLKWQSISLPS